MYQYVSDCMCVMSKSSPVYVSVLSIIAKLSCFSVFLMHCRNNQISVVVFHVKEETGHIETNGEQKKIAILGSCLLSI